MSICFILKKKEDKNKNNPLARPDVKAGGGFGLPPCRESHQLNSGVVRVTNYWPATFPFTKPGGRGVVPCVMGCLTTTGLGGVDQNQPWGPVLVHPCCRNKSMNAKNIQEKSALVKMHKCISLVQKNILFAILVQHRKENFHDFVFWLLSDKVGGGSAQPLPT